MVSKAHFLGREGDFLEKLDGIKPNRELHDAHIVVEPKMGAPMALSVGGMCSIAVAENIHIVHSPEFQMLKGMVLPFVWFKYVSIDKKEHEKSN